ncbi:DUF4173 domain-containing protein [Amycolatopsis rhabdoformis]|uniref:DUF4173 domain-containing protein n=1 Tax=Amycolatopsis rhabdoformis TaxID=1448059 RepID=A0ABZ1IKW7_9PSEU|nr:DUF4173 domain-containing protein [Amycolatopsis rhabdoformis]WSE34835.1 DUF4173 domain-containing protein [Amycolatopsis rhabdoformis]
MTEETRPAHAVPPAAVEGGAAEGAASTGADDRTEGLAPVPDGSAELAGGGVAVAEAPPFTPVLMRPVPKSAVVPMVAGVLPAVAVSGVVVAAVVPLDRPGIGWLLAGLVVAALIAVVDRRARGGESEGDRVPEGKGRTPRRASAAWAALALLLLAVGAVRAADWLFVLCVLAAAVAGSLAVVGPRSVNTALYDALAVPLEAFQAIPWVARGLRFRGTQRGRVLGAVLGAVAVLAVFLPLLTSADATFAGFVEALVPDLRVESVLQWVFLFCVGAFGTAGACYLLAAPPRRAVEGTRKAQGDSLVWTVPLVTLVGLFAVYVVVRIVELFGGTDYVRDTGGLTSAEYARGGFWQLCACTVLTLGIMALALRWAPRETAADRVRQRVLLGALAALSLVLVASALSRMWTYQEAYGFTVLRLLVEVCELWLGCVFLLVGAALVTLRSSWLPRAAIATAAGALLVLAVVNPEALIAGANIDRAEHGRPLDTAYLRGFSTDIFPVVAERLPDADCVLGPMLLRLDDDSWPGWNLSRARALTVKLPPPATC